MRFKARFQLILQSARCTPLLAVLINCTPSDGSGPWGLHVKRHFSFEAEPQQNELSTGFSREHEFWISLPVGTEANQFALVARDALRIEAGARVQSPSSGSMRWGANVASLGSTLLGERAHVGSVYSLGKGTLRMDPFAASSGYIKSARKIDRHPNAQVRIGMMEGADAAVERLSWTAPCLDLNNQNGPALRPTRTNGRSPTPLFHGHVLVERGRIARFGPGHHCLRTLVIRAGGTVAFDNLGGPVYLWIQDSLDIAGEMLHEASSLRNVLIGYSGSAAPVIQTAFRGILICPRAELKLPKTARAHEGAFFARELVIGEGAQIEYHAWDDALAP